MIDREKVMKALKCRVTDPVVECGNCPYNDATDDWRQRCDFHRLCADALALLREQEPRVMTWDELMRCANGYPAFIESRDRSGCWVLVYPMYMGLHDKDGYGVRWRYWTSRPTPEQMRETKWKGDSDAETP